MWNVSALDGTAIPGGGAFGASGPGADEGTGMGACAGGGIGGTGKVGVTTLGVVAGCTAAAAVGPGAMGIGGAPKGAVWFAAMNCWNAWNCAQS